jgi:hypothetical protein
MRSGASPALRLGGRTSGNEPDLLGSNELGSGSQAEIVIQWLLDAGKAVRYPPFSTNNPPVGLLSDVADPGL